MCGRFYLDITVDELIEHFALGAAPDFKAHYNIVPSQIIPVVRTGDAKRELAMMRWGLVPRWSKQIDSGYSLHNARAETVADKPAYRSAYKKRRCLVPASGFYEWQARPDGKQPYCIRLADGKPMALAGLWERWEGADDNVVESCTIIVTGANKKISPVHDRMPVIIAPADYDAWMSCGPETGQADALLQSCDSGLLDVFPVSRKVNNPANNDPGCITPIDA